MHVSDLTADWVHNALQTHGALGASERVASIGVAAIGTGQVADSYQIRLSADKEGLSLSSVVAKLTSEAEQSRAAGRTELNYLREVRFYQEVAPSLQARVPECYHAEIDSNNTEFVLLLEDLSPARPGNQLDGCTVEETALALRQAAGFHAPFWGGGGLKGSAWLDISDTYWPRFEEMLPTWFSGFRERYAKRMVADDLDIGAQFVANISTYYARLREMPFTIQHGDFRPDNVLFEVGGVPGTLAVLDWQTVILGPAAVDVAYFVGGALTPETRRSCEDDLLSGYHAELGRLGISDYTPTQLKADYAVATFHNFIIGVAAAMLVERSDRGDDLFCSMVSNAIAHARDRDGLTALTSSNGQSS